MFTAIGVVTTILVARFAMRALHYRRWARGGWGHRHGFHHGFHHGPFRGGRWRRGAVDLGDIGLADAGFDRDPYAPREEQRVDEILKALELNARQASEAGDVLSLLQGAAGRFSQGPQMALALRAVSRLPFDADLAAAAIGPRVAPEAAREAIDALEHLHNILTDEQRATLDRLTARR